MAPTDVAGPASFLCFAWISGMVRDAPLPDHIAGLDVASVAGPAGGWLDHQVDRQSRVLV
jgi:hypothetical protein